MHFGPGLSTEVVENNNHNSTWWLRDGDFIRLKNIELGLHNSKNIIGNNRFNNPILFEGLNLFNYSSFDLWDIEMAGNGLGYPPQRIINAGLQLNFLKMKKYLLIFSVFC